jgi:hypothetical protein
VCSFPSERSLFSRPGPAAILISDKFPRWSRGCVGVTLLAEFLIQVEADGDAIARISAVVQIISVAVVVQVHVIAVVPITRPVFRPRVDQRKGMAWDGYCGSAAYACVSNASRSHHRVSVPLYTPRRFLLSEWNRFGGFECGLLGEKPGHRERRSSGSDWSSSRTMVDAPNRFG